MARSMHVEPPGLIFPGTHISTLSRFTFQIYNDTDKKVRYEWRRYSSQAEEEKVLANYDISDPRERAESEAAVRFTSKIFQFDQQSGEIWPRRFIQATVAFSPELSDQYTETAYLHAIGTNDRVPVTLRGFGLAPEAKFSVQSIAVGHVLLDSIMEYKVTLKNTGRAVVDYSVEPKATPGLIFDITPAKGSIPVDNSVPINIRFVANSVCSFNETFTFKIRGATSGHPTINLYGKIIGPSYTINTKSLDFDVVSYGFLYTKTIEIENKSEIPFDYNFRLSHDGTFTRREFAFHPCSGTLGKFAKQTVQIEFIPVSIQEYNLQLYMDIAKFGQKLSVIPIHAKCICPDVKVVNQNIDLGNVYIGYPYKAHLELVDDTDFPAKFEYIPSNDVTQLEAKTVVNKPNGVVQAHSSTTMNMTVIPAQLGPMKVRHCVRIYGSDKPPIQFTVSAVCVGPKITLSREIIDFGKIQVLSDIKQSIELKNESVISATFTARIDDEFGVYTCEAEKGVIAPGGSMSLAVIANLDDNVAFGAKLILFFEHLNPIMIPIRATGTGTCIVPSLKMDKIDLGYIFTERPIIKEFTLENHGRKKQEIRWTCQKPRIEGGESATISVKIVPESITLAPDEMCDAQLILQCNNPCTFQANAQCTSALSKKRVDIFNPVIKGVFIKPLLQFSKQTLSYKHVHDIKAEEKLTGHIASRVAVVPSRELLPTLEQELVITNMSQIELKMNFMCPEPFTISDNGYALDPGASATFTVAFDPSFKTDFISEVITRKLTVSFVGHPQQLSVNLKGEVVFPNVTFEPGESVDFGIMMMNTEQTKDVTVRNTTELPVDIFWELMHDSRQEANAESARIFDIYPIRLHLDPFAEDIVRFSYFALGDSNGRSAQYEGTAICHVVGGPEYTLSLSGASAAIEYKLDPIHLDFGSRGYKEKLSKTLTLQNLSDVPITYAVKIPKGCSFHQLLVDNESGTVNVGQIVEISVQITTGLPIEYNEQFFIQIGHFDEVRIDAKVNCFVPQVQIDLERHEEDEIVAAFAEQQMREFARISQRKLGVAESDDEDRSIAAPTQEDLTTLERELFVKKLNERLNAARPQGQKRSKADKNKEPTNRFEGHISSKYVINMNKIVFGESETREFTIRSVCPYPVSFDIQDSALDGTGFSIEPTSFRDVPQGEDITVTVTFDTRKRTNELLGDVEFELPVILNEEMASMIYLRACLEMPMLSFSSNHFDFGAVIVGQSYIVTVQLQNMNPVACEYKFGNAQPMNILHRAMANQSSEVFTASPSTGILPPASFQNVEITFSPMAEKGYSMQFPIEIKHNTQPSYITLKGSGVQLKVQFDPPELVLPPLNPFSEPTTMSVKMINPTAYPIEVLSNQFDMQLLLDQLMQEQGIQEPTEEADDSLIQFGNAQNTSTVSKFSLCIIVHGASGSGQTSVCRALSASMNGAPIVSLKELWKEVLENPEASQADYVSLFSELIAQPAYSDGFIVDGLDCLPEPAETDQFLQHCMKQKNVDAELAKNPFMSFQHQQLTSCEQALAYVLAALDGHYVFLVGLRASEQILNDRMDVIKAQERRRKRIEQSQEKKMLVEMTEEQYLDLDEEQQQVIDDKRSALRNKVLRTALEEVQDQPSARRSRHHHSSSSKSGSGSRSKSSSRRKKDEGKEREPVKRAASRHSEQREEEAPKAKRTKLTLATATPIQRSVLMFQFTMGSLAQRVSDGAESFQVVDPIELLRDDIQQVPSELSIPAFTEEEDAEKRAKKRSKTPMPGTRGQEPVQTVFTSKNTVVIDVIGTPEDINESVAKFIPKLNQLKEKAFTKLIPIPRTLYSAACFKKVALVGMPKYFSIVVDDPVTDVQQMFPDSRPNSHQKKSSGRRSRKEKKEKTVMPDIPDDVDMTKRTQRWQIDPKSETTLQIRFEAKLIGLYKDVLTFNIQNAKGDNFKLPVSGRCAYPEVDRTPTEWFPKCVKRMEPKMQSVYVTDTNEFNWGSIMVQKERAPKMPAFYRQGIKLRNTSLFPTEVTAIVADNGPKSVWYTEKPTFTIQPGDEYEFVVGVHPILPEIYRTTLSMFIKDQPAPINIQLVAEGCIPQLEISKKVLEFGKMLLNQPKTLRLDIKNIGKLPAFWRLKNTQGLGPTFKFSSLEGTVQRASSFVDVTFVSAKPFAIKKAIQIEILDKEKTRVFATIPIQVEAEAFDVTFDWQYPKGMDHLQFGSMRVGQNRNVVCTLKNKGKYPSVFKVCVTNQRIQRLFTINPVEGTIPPGEKPLSIDFAFSAKNLVKYENMKAISLRITDTLTNTTTADLPLPFSAITHYSAFTIEPRKPIDFGPTPVNVPVTKQIKITNKGGFPFEYEIVQKDEPLVPKDPSAAEGKKGKKTASRAPSPLKGKGRRGTDKSVVIGNFQFCPSAATIAPGHSTVVDVEYYSQFAGHSQASALVKITDCNPKEVQDGIPLSFSGDAYMPGIQTTGFEEIFPGTHLCLSFDVDSVSNSVSFLEDNQMLHFAPLVLQQKAVVPVVIINPQPIKIAVDMNILPPGKNAKPVKAGFPFEITEKSIQLEPNSRKTIDLSFLPVTPDKFSGFFEAVVKNGTQDGTRMLRFGIEGAGTLPSICAFGQGDAKGVKNGMYQINLGRTLVGFSKEKIVSIMNDGLINAKITITARPTPDFILKGFETTEEIVVEPDHMINIPVIFQPEKVRKSVFEILISVIDNPKANLGFTFTGEGFSEDVMFEGLSEEDQSVLFKDNIVGRQQEATFIMRNVSQNDIRFSWQNHNDFVFSPKVGHLRLGRSKEIKVTFFTEKPTKHNGLRLNCQWSKIELDDPDSPDWDDSMKLIKFVTKGSLAPEPAKAPATPAKKSSSRRSSISTKKASPPPEPVHNPDDDEIVRVTEIKPEPTHQVLPGKFKDLQVKINAVSDFIRYTLDVNEIEFSPTMMFQTRAVECKITNTSQIRLEYQWLVKEFVSLRQDYGRDHLPPFSVQPASGYIESGQSTTFRARFTPEEVDDFRATLVCDIPYLSQMEPPKVKVTGLSRRPLCHFDAITSDYISAGRRHPDYNQPVPDDVRVIEIFSKSVGSRATKKFAIINPTAGPYEIMWTMAYDNSNGQVMCDTPNAIVSSGRKHFASFTYVPTSVKTVETLYEFQIPEHNVRVPVLVVGRIMPTG